MIKHYLTICFRNLKKYQTQSIISIVGLSIGFLSFMLCNYYVQYHLFYNAKIPNAGRIYKLETELTESDLNQEFPEIEKILPLSTSGIYGMQENYTISIEDKDVSYQGFFSKSLYPSFIDFFSLSVVSGSKEAIARTDNSVVLFESAAQKLTKDIHSLIGKELKTDNNQLFYITGILKDPPENSTLGNIKRFYFSNGQQYHNTIQKIHPNLKGENTYYLQINKNVSKQKFMNKLELYFNKIKNDDESGKRYEIEPFIGLSNFGEYNINICKFLSIFGLLILLSTLFNFILFQFSMYYNNFKGTSKNSQKITYPC